MKLNKSSKSDVVCLRTDSWASQLTPEQQEELYELARQPGASWYKVAQEAVQKYGLKKAPSQSSFYDWKRKMRQKDRACRLEDLAASVAQAAVLGKTPVTDEALLAVYDTLAAEAALDGDARQTACFSSCAAAVAARIARRQDLALKERALRAKEEELARARAKEEADGKRAGATKKNIRDAMRAATKDAAAIAAHPPDDDTLLDVFRTLIADAACKGDVASISALTQCATSLQDRCLRQLKFDEHMRQQWKYEDGMALAKRLYENAIKAKMAASEQKPPADAPPDADAESEPPPDAR